jgi:hypothetical protein
MAIARLSVERDPARPTTELQVLAEVRSYGSPNSGELVLSESGRDLLSERVSAAPNRPHAYSFEIASPPSQSVLAARLTPSGRDDLADDNTAYAIRLSARCECCWYPQAIRR